MRDDIRELLTLMAPFGPAGEVMGADVRDGLAAEYPADYVEFLAVYGAGTVDAHS